MSDDTVLRHALLRGVPDSFADAIVGAAGLAPDVDAARRQHAGYRRSLEAAGISVLEIPADDHLPDCPFVEDTAVVVGERALLTRLGAPSRQPEVDAVAVALAERIAATDRMSAPATLDGGDVLELGASLFVGRSARTNGPGIAALAEFAAPAGYEVVPVDFTGGLHLKSVVNRLDDTTVLLAPGCVAAGTFAPARVVETVAGERGAANVLALGGGRVLVPADAPDTAARIAAAGFAAIPVEVGEFAKADGGLTCLSVRW